MNKDYSPKFTVNVSEELFNRIEDYRFEKRFQSRKDAMIAILEKGLEVVEWEMKQEKDNTNGKG